MNVDPSSVWLNGFVFGFIVGFVVTAVLCKKKEPPPPRERP